jgi:tetratricopeptide (TPR) repeat protein
MHPLRLLALSLCVSLAVAPALAGAQARGGSEPMGAEAEARAAFEGAAVAFAEARFLDALAGFERSFELSGRVELQYNMALCHDRLGHDAEALAAFTQYLQGRPDASNRADVEQRILTLRARIGAREELERQAREGSRTPPPADEGSPMLGWVLAGSGGVLLVGGAVALFLGLADVSAIESAPVGSSWASDQARYDRGPTLEWVGGLGLGIGAALAATGFAFALSTGSDETQLSLGPTGVSLRGSF